jgi:predicted Holliday junction resolvase-like endonuclease
MVITIVKLRDKIRRLTLALNTNIDKYERSKKISRSVIKGQVSEQMFPLKIDCPFHISDMKFIGAPIDYIVFNGLSTGKVTSIEFVDVKTGSSKLSSMQKTIKESIDNGKFAWKTITIKEEEDGDY